MLKAKGILDVLHVPPHAAGNPITVLQIPYFLPPLPLSLLGLVSTFCCSLTLSPSLLLSRLVTQPSLAHGPATIVHTDSYSYCSSSLLGSISAGPTTSYRRHPEELLPLSPRRPPLQTTSLYQQPKSGCFVARNQFHLHLHPIIQARVTGPIISPCSEDLI